MGTNYYWNKNKINQTDKNDFLKLCVEQDKKYFINKGYNDIGEEYFYHIGKFSAAGLFCEKCNTTSCREGIDNIHEYESTFDNICPICGEEIKTTTCSFTWYDFNRDRYLLEQLKNDERKLIVNEYEEEYTVVEFLEKVNKAKIWRFSKELFS